jgi:hypothetical protein
MEVGSAPTAADAQALEADTNVRVPVVSPAEWRSALSHARVPGGPTHRATMSVDNPWGVTDNTRQRPPRTVGESGGDNVAWTMDDG